MVLYQEAGTMGVVEIEEAIKVLPTSDVAEWVVDYHHRIWDEQIAEDLETGKLDNLLAEVEAEYQATCQAGRRDNIRTSHLSLAGQRC
jgi:hypothetical protein